MNDEVNSDKCHLAKTCDKGLYNEPLFIKCKVTQKKEYYCKI